MYMQWQFLICDTLTVIMYSSFVLSVSTLPSVCTAYMGVSMVGELRCGQKYWM